MDDVSDESAMNLSSLSSSTDTPQPFPLTALVHQSGCTPSVLNWPRIKIIYRSPLMFTLSAIYMLLKIDISKLTLSSSLAASTDKQKMPQVSLRGGSTGSTRSIINVHTIAIT